MILTFQNWVITKPPGSLGYQGTTYEVLREMTVTPGWEPPALLNDFYKEVTA